MIWISKGLLHFTDMRSIYADEVNVDGVVFRKLKPGMFKALWVAMMGSEELTPQEIKRMVALEGTIRRMGLAQDYHL